MRANYRRLSTTLLCAYAVLRLAGCGVSPLAPNALPTTSVHSTSNVASGPVLGYWWDSAATGLRPTYGIAGAAHLGQPSFNDGTFSGAVVCAHGSFALLTSKAGVLFVAKLPSGQPSEVIDHPLAKAQILLSPSCTSAIEYATDGSASFLIQGLPSAPKVVPLALSGAQQLMGVAVADSSSLLLATGQPDGSAAIQFLASGSNATTPVTTLSKFGGINFLPNADTALIADAGQNTVVRASQLSGSVSLTSVASAASGVSQPIAVAASADGRTAVIANSASLLRVDLSGQSAPVKVTCSCSPAELVPLAGNLVFRLNEPSSGTVWAFDGDAVNPRVVFLPNAQPTSGAGANQ